MVLSIFTAVVSESMISGSSQCQDEELSKTRDESMELQQYRLLTLFKETDKHGDGMLNEHEFNKLLGDEGFRDELCAAARLKARDLKDIFTFLSCLDRDGQWKVRYVDFVEKLQCEADFLRERSAFRLEKVISLIGARLNSKFQTTLNELDASQPLHTLGRHVIGSPGIYESGSKVR